MREKVAEFLNWYGNSDHYVDWHVNGNDAIKSRRREQAKDFLALIAEEVEKVENRYPDRGEYTEGFVDCRQAVLGILEEK